VQCRSGGALNATPQTICGRSTAPQVELADGSKAWVIDILDDHARFAIGATVARRFTATAAWRAMEIAISEHGAPRQLISDNGTQFISRDSHQPVHFQQRMAAMGIRQLSSRPAHPQTCGKLERYHRTFKDFYADHGPAGTIEELQALCDQFRWHYNHQRPHQGIGQQVPADVYQALRKVGPGDPRPRRRKTGPRVLMVGPTGSVNYRKRKIGIGQHWKGQRVTVIETKPDYVVVLDRTTGARQRSSSKDSGTGSSPSVSAGARYLRIVLRSMLSASLICTCDRPAFQCRNISTKSVTFHDLLATSGPFQDPRWGT
jgi:transposase InsO family protein